MRGDSSDVPQPMSGVHGAAGRDPVVSETVSSPSHHKPPTLSPIPSQGLYPSLTHGAPKNSALQDNLPQTSPVGFTCF